MKIEIGLISGKVIVINRVTGFNNFREFANHLIDCHGFVVFGGCAIRVNEVEYIEEITQEVTN